MQRRSKVSQTAGKKLGIGVEGLRIGDTKGLASPVSPKSTTIALRLSGPWHDLWQLLREAVPGVSDSELLRQGLVLRMALAATDAHGRKPSATLQFHDDNGELKTVDLKEYVGLDETTELKK